MDTTESLDILAAFTSAPEVVTSCENRALVRGKVDDTDGANSYATVSWDHYFHDLSHGGFRKHIDGNHYTSRRRAWHFLFKNLKLIEELYAQPSRPMRVLDVGCSSGYLRRFIEGNASPDDDHRIRYWGLDVREEMLRRAVFAKDDIESGASGTYTPSAFVLHDVKFGLPFRSDFFDTIVNFEMIKYLPVDQCEFLIAESNRCLRADGTLYLSFPTDYEYYAGRKRYSGFAQALPPEDIERMIVSNGFSIVQTYGSQSKFSAIEPAISDEHRPLFAELLTRHPREIVAAIFAPLYPGACSQITFKAVKANEKRREANPQPATGR